MSTTPEFLAAELEAGAFGPSMVQNEQALRIKAAAELRRLAAVEAERDRLRAENENLRTVMIAAAEEIHAHWDAHCDAEGYGPANLMHRLEKGIPAEYAYKAGDFQRLRAEVEALRADAERYRWLRESSANQWVHPLVVSQERTERGMHYAGPLTGRTLDAAVDEARKG